MDVCISREFLGLRKHLIFNSAGELSWVDEVPANCFIWGSGLKSFRSFEHLVEMVQEDDFFFQNKPLFKSLQACGISPHQAHLSYFYDRDEFQRLLNDFVAEGVRILSLIERHNYGTIFLNHHKLLAGMRPARVNKKAMAKIKPTIKNKGVLKTLSVDPEGYLSPTVYTTTKTITGRMTIESGTQILTAPKELRTALASRWKDGQIIEVDFTSLEPRVAMELAKKDDQVPEDIYHYFAKDIFEGGLNREQCKIAVLSAMYGAGSRTLSRMLPSNIKASSVLKKIRNELNFEKLVEDLKIELQANGFMYNFYGRPVFSNQARDALIYNHYVQSTAVDAALLGFSWLLEQFNWDGQKIVPIFLIHDALIIDATPGIIDQLTDKVSSGLFVENFGYFPTKLKRLDNIDYI